jgi:hypothetical protein
MVRMAQHGGDCHLDVDRVAYNPGQISGDYIYIFRTPQPCTRVTFGKRRVAIAPIEPHISMTSSATASHRGSAMARP